MRIAGPAHPEQTNGDSRGAEHGIPKSEFWGEAGAATLLNGSYIALCPAVD